MQDETTYILEPTAFHSMKRPRFSPPAESGNVAANIKPQNVLRW